MSTVAGPVGRHGVGEAAGRAAQALERAGAARASLTTNGTGADGVAAGVAGGGVGDGGGVGGGAGVG